MAFYEIRPELLKNNSDQLRLRVFYDRGSDIMVWEEMDSDEINSFQLSFRNLHFIGEPEVLIEWRKSRSLKFGQVDEGSRLMKMTGIIHFKPLMPMDSLQRMLDEFERRSRDIDPAIRTFILDRLEEGLATIQN